VEGFGDPFDWAGGDFENAVVGGFPVELLRSFGAAKALQHIQTLAGESETIEPLLFGRARARAEGFDDLAGHFVMVIANVMKDEVGGGVNDFVGAEDTNFGIAEWFFVPAVSYGHELAFVGSFVELPFFAILGDGWEIGVGAEAFFLVILEVFFGDVRDRVAIVSVPTVPIAVGEVTGLISAGIADGEAAMGPKFVDEPFFGRGGFEVESGFEPADVEPVFARRPYLVVLIWRKIWVIGHF
jgi:hypothetical protein